jgi:hypothetical protein
MSKVTLYSRSVRSRAAAAGPDAPAPAPPRLPFLQRAAGFARRHERALWPARRAADRRLLRRPPHFGAMPRELTQDDIDAAVMHTLDTKTPPSVYAKAFEAILPSVVRVKNMTYDQDEDGDRDRGSGTGVESWTRA